ncbi:hypothetical protein BDR26DRAFT_900564 [Obelidium mucronatum]|nr:hypothetical protein BDR26DRAFT_900564 [Obelidium mucronatum]
MISRARDKFIKSIEMKWLLMMNKWNDGVALELLDFCVVFGTKLEQQQQPQDQQNQTPQPSADDNNETTTFFEKAISLISTYPQEIPSTVGLTCLDLISRHFTIHKRFEKAAASHRAKAQFQITLLQRQQQQQEQQQQPDTAVDMNDLLNSFSNAGDCFINAGQHHAAESQYLEVYHRMSTVVPPTYPLFLELLKEWAVKCESSLFHEMWIEKLRDLEKAVWFWKEAVLMAQDSFGVDHAQTLEVKRTVGFSLKALGRYELAEEYYVSVLAVYEKAFGFGDRKTVVVSVGLAELYEQSGKLDLAEQQYLKHVHILIKKEGIQSSVTMDLVKWLAKFYIRRGRWLEAKHLCLHRVVFDGLVAKQFPLSRDPTVHDDMLNVLSHLEGGDIAGDAGEARIKQLIEVEGKQEFQKLMKK